MNVLIQKQFVKVFLFFIIVTIAVMVWQIIQNYISQKFDINQMPDIPLYFPNGEQTNIYESSQNQYVLLSFIQSECDYCKDEIKQLSDSIGFVKDLKVFLISSESTKQLEFINTLITNERITLLFDKDNTFAKTLKVSNYPSLFLFDKNKKFLKHLKGSVSVSKIASEIH